MFRIVSRRRGRLDATDSGVLSDLAFLLIIFFVVIAVFNVNSGLLLGLPGKESTKMVHREELLRVHLTSTGSYEIAGSPATVEELRESVRSLRRREPNMTLLATIDPEAPYGAMVSLVDLVRGLEVDNFSFRMEAGE